MAVLKRPDGEIHYQTFGNGFPVLLFAPGGLRSRMEMWPAAPGWTAATVGRLDQGAAGSRLHRRGDGPTQRRCAPAPPSRRIMAGTPTPPTTSR